MANFKSAGETRPEISDVLERKIRQSRRALAFERAWPRVWLPLGVAGLFILISLVGVWPVLAPMVHKGLLAGFAVAFFAALIPLIRLRWPTRHEAIRRLESLSGIPHRPASSYDDTLTMSAGNAASERLWRAHRDRLAATFSRLRVFWPRPRVDRYDPFALRAALVLLIGFVFIVSGDAAYDRLVSSMRFGAADAPLKARVDAWLTPPVYTGKPPQMLANALQPLSGKTHETRILEAPEGSVLVVRVSGGDAGRFSVAADAGPDGEPREIERESGEAVAGDLAEFRFKLNANGRVAVRQDGSEILSWRFRIDPDGPPSIALTEPASQSARGALRLKYKVEDDFGVVSGEAAFALADKLASAASPAPDDGSDAFFAPPKMMLKLPRANAKTAEGQTYKDLTAHPWAGLEVDMTLSARDQAGQVGKGEPVRMKLPERRFTQPLAKAVVEQRRKLFLNPDRMTRVADALDALTIAPEEFIGDKVVYLGLRTANWRLRHDGSRQAVKSVIDLLWSVALRIEDGDLSDAERALRDAQDRLSKALEEGASPEEIERLMQELRTALNRFLRSLAQQNRDGQQNQAQQAPPNSQMLSSQDLDQMLRNIEEMAKSGSRENAQQMLSQLRDMLERLQTGRMANSEQSNRAMEMIEKFGKMIQDQQRLLDETFRNQQGQQGQRGQQGQQGQFGQQGEGRRGQQGQQGQGGQRGGQSGQGLAQRQGDLRRQLEQLMDELRNFGSQPDNALNGAGRAMGEAEQELQQDEFDGAAEQQSLALDRLRKGAQSMAEQMMQGMAGQSGNQRSGRDPMGRSQGARGQDFGTDVEVPDELDVQQVRRILEELRRRLSEPNRPPVELKYLERLLERF